MQHGSLFCFIDGIPVEHGADAIFYPALIGQLQQQLYRFVYDDVPGIIKNGIPGAAGIFFEAVRILRKARI
jgi:hypothetical protein